MQHLPGETILFNSEFNDESLSKFYKEFTDLEKAGTQAVTILINSPGGSVACLHTMLDLIYNTDMMVTTAVSGEACSCGFLLLMAGDYRLAFSNAQLMSHQYTWGRVGKHHELKASRKAQDDTFEFMLRHYKLHTGLDENTIIDKLLPPDDVWLTPEEALKFNIIDEIIEPAKKIGYEHREELKSQADVAKNNQFVDLLVNMDKSVAKEMMEAYLSELKENEKAAKQQKKASKDEKKVKRSKKSVDKRKKNAIS